MKTIENVQNENMELLSQIYNLRLILNEIYTNKGPANSDYISLSVKLNSLVKEYIEEKMSMLKDELMEIWKQKGF